MTPSSYGKGEKHMETSAQSAGEQPVAMRLLLACGGIGPLLNIVVILVLGATRPGYNAWQVPDSNLELGVGGWIQITNYLVTGALVLGFAIGFRRVLRTGRGSTWGPILLGIYRSEEHTSELQSHLNLVCRLLLEKKKTYHKLVQFAC